MWSLASPIALGLLPLPLLAARFWRRAVPAEDGDVLLVPETVAALFGVGRLGGALVAARCLLPALLWVALVTALAGPRVLAPSPALPTSGRDIVLAFDLSGSMEERDFELDGAPVRRLDAVKRAAIDFVRRRAGDRVGFVAFADKAYFAAPPTHDVEAVAQALEEATIGIAGRSTAISEGLGLALKRLERSQARSRVVVLMSDGVNTGGAVQPIDAAEFAGRLGIRVHTIALGRHDTRDTGGQRDVVDAEALRAIAEASGGAAFRVRSTADLDAIGNALDALDPTRIEEERVIEVYRDLWPYPASIALLLALALMVPRWVRA
jgi:Ca-activated chloride channel family protein